ncbi:MAG TPA: Calx-beta domain-containing protein, partial [Parafilimonas sp.]|nr:Calx-beta domain-containing protein [Parafilimonas sp.]
NIDSVYNASICIQPDGKIVVLGTHGQVDNYHPNYFVLLRHTIDGSLDSSFGINGRVNTYFDSGPDFGLLATSLLIQPDGKLVAGGFKWGSAQPQYYILARYLPDGTLDSAFGENGKVIHEIGPFPKENELNVLALQADGKILAGGNSDGYCVVRYKANGSIDSSFANNGILRDQNFYGGLSDLLLQKDGKIITAGGAAYAFNVPQDFLINRISSNGTFDSSFGTNGFVLTDFYGGSDGASSVVQLNDTSFIVGGYAHNDTTSSNYNAFAVYKKNGNLFRPFGVNGKTTIAGPTSANMKVLVDTYGRIISAGSILVRLNTNGIVDSTFGENGKAINFQGAQDAVLQADQKIVTMNSGFLQRFIEDEPIVSIAKNISLIEGNIGYSAAKFKVLLNHSSASTVKVNYTTKNGTAQAGSDYVAASGTATIKPGNVSKIVTVNVIGDNTYESNEKFSLVLTNPVNALLGDLDSATCTIKNDDPLSSQQQTSTDAISYNSTIKLFPNPAKDQLTIGGLSSQLTTVCVIDMRGKTIIQTSANNRTSTINIKQLSPRVYYLRIATAEKVTTLKFIKQ